jgi:tRNA nucleotidyltransferase (CCA-adding enzyme)
MEVCIRLAVSEHYREKLAEMRRKGIEISDAFARKRNGRKEMQRSEIYTMFSTLSVEVLLHLMARTSDDAMKKALSLYFTQLQNVHCLITGKDILEIGVPKGPKVGKLLQAVMSARLNGLVLSREDEIQYAKEVYQNMLQ